jgi:hypothetical protein
MNSRFSFTSIGAFQRSQLQWQPTLTSHDPNPPITLEDAAAVPSEFVPRDRRPVMVYQPPKRKTVYA